MDKSKPPTQATVEAACLITPTRPDTPAALDLHALTDTLTPAQYAGRACITCGASDTILKPLGKLLDRDVVECETHEWRRRDAAGPASWLTQPCPRWCTDAPDIHEGFTIHRASDCPEDRRHSGDYFSVPLHTMDYVSFGPPASPSFKAREVMANLVQHYREAEPRICLSDDVDTFAIYMTLDEARRHRDHLTELLADAAQTGGAL